MIVTLTVNPAIDRTIVADRLVFEDRAYILSSTEAAGGRGINASAVIHSFGGNTHAIAAAGGKAGERFADLLKTYAFPVSMLRIRGETRTNLAITDKHGLTVKLNEPGPHVEAYEVAQLRDLVVTNLDKASWLLLCGSLTPGVNPSFYAELIELARARNVKTLLDTDGDALEQGIEAKPSVVAPNQAEAERLLNRALLTRAHFFEAAGRIKQMGADSVILSLGSRGAIAGHEGELHELVPPRVEAVSPIGAGDALNAAFVWAFRARNVAFVDAVRWGVAAGTASAMRPGLQFATLDQTKAIYKQVDVRPA